MTFSINLPGPPWIFLHGSKCGFHICAFLPSRAQCWRLQTQNTYFGKGSGHGWDGTRTVQGVPEGNPFPTDRAGHSSKDEQLRAPRKKTPTESQIPHSDDVLHSCNKFWTSASRTHCRGDTEAKSQLVEVWNHNRSCHSMSFFNAQVQKWCQSSPLRSSNSIKCPQVRPVGATAAGCHIMPGYFF